MNRLGADPRRIGLDAEAQSKFAWRVCLGWILEYIGVQLGACVVIDRSRVEYKTIFMLGKFDSSMASIVFEWARKIESLLHYPIIINDTSRWEVILLAARKNSRFILLQNHICIS